MALVDQVDEALERLYKQRGLEYANIFKAKCEENGLEDDDSIAEEMQGALDESQFADEEFLKDFCPWIPEGDDRLAEIFEILKECYQDPNAFKSIQRQLSVKQQDFTVTKEDIERTKNLLKQQAPSIYETAQNDSSLMCMMAVTHNMQNNYIQYLVDMFTREKLYVGYRARTGGAKSQYDCAQFKDQNPHMKELHNFSADNIQKEIVDNIKKETVSTLAVAGIKSFCHRVAPKLMFCSHGLIKFPLRIVVQYIEQTIMFVHVQATKVKKTCPFQYDSVFAFEEFIAKEEDQDEDDDDEDDEDGDGNDDPSSFGAAKSQLPDIKKGLTTTKLTFKSTEWGKIDGRNYRPLGDAFKELKDSAAEKDFPQFNRFCSVLDLRNDPEKEEKADDKDNLFVFQPEESSRKIYKKASALNYFHNARKSVIPCLDPKDGNKEAALNALSQGPQLMLSFHVEAEDSMRCYLFINGQCTRFLPEDLKLLLPVFFDPNTADNKDFEDSEEMDEIITALNGKLRDDQFQTFLKQNKVKSPLQSK